MYINHNNKIPQNLNKMKNFIYLYLYIVNL